MSASHTARIEAIDAEASKMARSILDQSRSRTELQNKAEDLRDDLMWIVQELTTDHPALYEELSPTISESLLDLKFVLDGKTKGVSLRLNHAMQARKKAQGK